MMTQDLLLLLLLFGRWWTCLDVDGCEHVFGVAMHFAVIVSGELVHVMEEHLPLKDANVAPDVQVGRPVVSLLRFCRQDAGDVLLALQSPPPNCKEEINKWW